MSENWGKKKQTLFLLQSSLVLAFFFFYSGGFSNWSVSSNLLCSGGPAASFKEPEEKTELSKNNAETPAVSENVESRIEAARERFLARKGHK